MTGSTLVVYAAAAAPLLAKTTSASTSKQPALGLRIEKNPASAELPFAKENRDGTRHELHVLAGVASSPGQVTEFSTKATCTLIDGEEPRLKAKVDGLALDASVYTFT